MSGVMRPIEAGSTSRRIELLDRLRDALCRYRDREGQDVADRLEPLLEDALRKASTP